MTSHIHIREDDLSSGDIRDLVRLHLKGMHANSPAEYVFALGIEGLKSPDVTFWSAWINGKLAGIGALKELDGKKGEVKSMRTHPSFLQQGVASALLKHIISIARARGMIHLSLETGTGPAFKAAVGLYCRYGFAFGAPFADYEENPFSQFLHLPLVKTA